MHAAEGSEPAACSGQRATIISYGGSSGSRRADRIEIARPAAARSGGAIPPLGIVPGPAASPSPAAEGSEPTAGGGLHVVNRFSNGPLAPEGNAVRTNPLAGEGALRAGMDVSSLNLDPAASDGRRVFSREDFVRIAVPLLAQGATWRQVGDACGLSWRAAKGRGEHAGLVSKRGPGRPLGALHTPETRARITETLRRRRLEGR